VIKCGVPQGSILGPLLRTIVNKDNHTVLSVDDTSIIIKDSNGRDFNINATQTFQDKNTWFNINLLKLNFNETQYLEFRTKNYCNVNTQIKHDQKYITNAAKIKFLGLTIDDTLSWKQPIEQVVNKMCSACYALRNIKHIVPVDTLRVI
jgi:protein associated with RNAse G/E